MEPGEQATSYTVPSWSGPRLQRTLPLKSHPKATSWEGCQAGRQRTTRRPGVWPQFPSSQHAYSHPTGEQKPRYLPQGSASLAWAPTDPARRPQQLCLLFRGPITSNSLASARAKGGFPEGFLNGLADKHPVSGACGSWPGLARPQRGWSNNPSEVARIGVAIPNCAVGLRGRTQEWSEQRLFSLKN